MQNDINKIVSNALLVNKENINKNITKIISCLEKAIDNNKETIISANKIDNNNNNGFLIDLKVIKNILINLQKEDMLYGNIIVSQKDDNKKIMYGKQIMDRGNVIVITDGNPYTIIEMAIRNILAGNTTIFSNNGYMYGTNQLLIQIIQSVLEKLNISKNLVQIYISETFDDILSNYANIDLVVCIGSRNLQNLVLSKTKNQIITSGYENFDIYIEDDSHIEFINKIINTGLNINLYVNKDSKLTDLDAIIVDDVDEAIAQINYNGSKYSVAIFTKSHENAAKFIKEIKASNVMVNTSPTIERILDIKQTDLITEKTVIYPFDIKVTNTIKINIKKDNS